MTHLEMYKTEKEISAKFEKAIDALLENNLEAYILLREAKQFAEEKRKEIQNERGLEDCS